MNRIRLMRQKVPKYGILGTLHGKSCNCVDIFFIQRKVDIFCL